jgi:hypothetical protein
LVFLAMTGVACGGGASKPRAYVPVLLPHSSALRYQPQRLIPAGDGSEIVTGIHYKDYGGARAQATGTLLIDDCVSSCAAGAFHPVTAKLVFSKLIRCHGRRVYTTLEITAPAARRFNHDAHQTAFLTYLAARCGPGRR